DLQGVAAQVGVAASSVDVDGVVRADGIDLGAADGVEAGTDRQRVAAQVGVASPADVFIDGVVRADGVDRVLDGRADLQGVAAQVGVAASSVDVDGVVRADGIDLGVAGGVQAGTDLQGIAAQVGVARRIDVDVDRVVF